MMGAVLSERKQVLAKIVTEVPNVLEVIEGTECSSVESVFECFNNSVKNNEEGIIIKAQSSVYQPNLRSLKWVKLKSEYMDSIGDTLDLLVIGGYFGEKKRTGASNEW
jgi:ATP-dependent DNA ligase